MNDDSDDLVLDEDDEVEYGPDDPKELRTQADDDRPLSHAEAAVGGVIPGLAVYGDSSQEPNADDHRDAERGA